jgi:dipeptidyl aminopeptidase/acylaminoacyl peptidase
MQRPFAQRWSMAAAMTAAIVCLTSGFASISVSADMEALAAPQAGTNQPSDQRPVTIDDVLNLKSVASAVVSPDGTQVLYTVRAWEESGNRMESRSRIWMVPVAGGASRQIAFGERGDSQPQWSPDGRHISFVSARGSGSGEDAPKAQIYVMRSDGGEAWKVTDAKENVASYSWAPDSHRIAYVATDPRPADKEAAIRRRDDARVFEGDFRYQHIWIVEINSTRSGSRGAESSSAPTGATRLTDGTSYTVSGAPSWAPDSGRLVFSAKPTTMIRDYRSDVYIADVASKAVEKISTNAGPDTNPQWSPDGALIAWTAEPITATAIGDGTLPSYIGHGHLTLYDVARKATRDVWNAGTDVDVNTPHWNPDGKQIVFVSGKRSYAEAFSFDVASQTYTQLTREKTLSYGSRSRDGAVIAVTMDSPHTPGEVYVTDAAFSRFNKLTDTNPQAKTFALGETEVVTWKSSDGWDVEGVLLKPVGFTPGTKYPTLVVAHGGPAGAFVNNYRVGGLEGGQFWAGQGWAVFYPNPRGSTNYGEKFLRANINDWGGGDYRDIMTGVDALVARGIADPDRLAHIGWSYGGYMTAWVVTQTNRFKAAMVGAGLTNMWSMYGTNDIPNVLVSYFGGYPTTETLPLYFSRSAMSFIDKVQTPTLILHGANDERVPTGQALEMYRGLKDRGKTTDLVFYPRAGHGITEYYHQKDRLTRIHDWVTRYTLGSEKTTTQ